jgi:hypothetical protein
MDKIEDSTLTTYSAPYSTCHNNLDPNICYNKFLQFYNLPLLPNNQNIQTLIQHIDKHNNNSQITHITFSVNLNSQETHIYLPHKPLLPGYTIIFHIYFLDSIYSLSDPPLPPFPVIHLIVLLKILILITIVMPLTDTICILI